MTVGRVSEGNSVDGIELACGAGQTEDGVFLVSLGDDAQVAFVVTDDHGVEFFAIVEAFKMIGQQSVGVGRSLSEACGLRGTRGEDVQSVVGGRHNGFSRFGGDDALYMVHVVQVSPLVAAFLKSEESVISCQPEVVIFVARQNDAVAGERHRCLSEIFHTVLRCRDAIDLAGRYHEDVVAVVL